MSTIDWNILYIADPDKFDTLGFGKLYVGEPGLEPIANPKQLNVVQEDGTVVPISQPMILSAGGVPTYNGSTVRLDVDGDYSIKVLDVNDNQKYFIDNVVVDTSEGGGGGASGYVATMVALSPESGDTFETISYIEGEMGGGAQYLAKTPSEASADGDSIDGFSNHTAANANVWILQKDGIVDFRMSGGRVYDAGSPIDNSAALLAAIAQSFTVLIVGDYYFSVAVDLSTLSDPGNPRAQVIGTRNKNVDGTDSQLTFDGTSGITVTAGCKIEDLEIRNIGSIAGTGLHLADVHSSSVRNVTITNFTRGAYIFAFQSRLEMIISYQCETGLEFYGECTSLTVQSCWARSGTYGFIIGRLVAYSTFLNCAVDDVFVPYTVAGDNVHLDQCGAEINLDYYNVSIGNTDYATDYITEIEGYIRFDSSAGGASTVTISGGRYIMVPTPADSPEPEHTYTAESAVYSVPAANNESSVVAFSRMTSNSFANISDSFIMGKLRAVVDDSCTFTDVFPLKVKTGDFGSIMIDGRSSATLRRHAKATAKIGNTQDDAASFPNNLAIIIEEVIDFQVAITAGDDIFIKSSLLNADSHLQFKVEMYPQSATGSYTEWAGWSFGSSSRHGSDVVGSGFGFTGNDAGGFQNFYFDRTAIQGPCLVRIIATGWPDSEFRDRLITLTVGPDDA